MSKIVILVLFNLFISCQTNKHARIKSDKGKAKDIKRLNDENNTVRMDTSIKQKIIPQFKNNFKLPLREWKIKNKQGKVIKSYPPMFVFNNNFPTARGIPAYRVENNLPVITVVSMPENLVKKSKDDSGAINDSPWYAFKLSLMDSVKSPQKVMIEITAGLGEPFRYLPWMKAEGSEKWTKVQNLEQLRYHSKTKKTRWVKSTDSQVAFKARFSLTLNPSQEVTISAQPTHSAEHIHQWMKKVIAKHSNVSQIELELDDNGHQVKTLNGFLISKDKDLERKTLILTGGMHPPEVTGRVALEYYVEELLISSTLTKEFLQKHNVVVFPLLNELGITEGNWRHNRGGIDINRDWGPDNRGFNSPETRAFKAYIEDIEKSGAKFVSFVDFHSTYSVKAYTPLDSGPNGQFIECIAENIRQENPQMKNWQTIKLPLNKYSTSGAAWAARELKVPSIVLEYADKTTEEELEIFSKTIAKIYMKRLLNPNLCQKK